MSRTHRSTLGFGHFPNLSVIALKLISIKSVAWTAAAEAAPSATPASPRQLRGLQPWQGCSARQNLLNRAFLLVVPHAICI